MSAVSLSTGGPAEVPGALAEVGGAAHWAATDDAIAWIDSEGKELWVWHTGWAEPWQAISSWQHDHLQWVQVAGDIVSWHGTNAQYALDLRSGSYTQVASEDGWQFGSDPFLHVGFHTGYAQSGQPLPSEQTVVDTRSLPQLPGCS